MQVDTQEEPDFAKLIQQSRTKANRLFYALIVVSVFFFVFYGPRLVDTVRARLAGLEGIGYAEAQLNNEMWRKNLTCTTVVSDPPPSWDEAKRREFVGDSRTTQDGDRITAKVCKSGDVFIHYQLRDGRERFMWVPADNAYTRQK